MSEHRVRRSKSALFHRMGTDLSDPSRLLGLIEERRQQERPELAVVYRAPRTAVEEVLAEIWAHVLGVERVGVHDDFFGLGGQSLLATQVLSRAARAFGVELPLRTIFEHRTIESLARSVEAARQGEPAWQVPRLAGRPPGAEAPLSSGQERLWFLDRLQPGSAAYNVPLALRLRGSLDRASLERALTEIERRHEGLRTTFPEHGGKPIPSVTRPRAFPLPGVDLTALSDRGRESEARRLARSEAAIPFDLASGPLFRGRLFRLGERDHLLLLNVHHIVTDGWSTGVLARELSLLYRSFSQGGPAQLPELPIQYADYAYWQRQWLTGPVLTDALAYWKRRLGSAPPVLELPTDRPRPPLDTFHGARYGFALPPALSAALSILGREQNATLFMVLLAAFDGLLGRLAAVDSITIGSPVAGRLQPETEPLIGLFINTVALRTDVAGDPSFVELLARARETALEAFAHQQLPFEKVVEELQPRRSLGHSPLFQILFILQNVPAVPVAVEGLDIQPVALDPGAARFDLTLSLSPSSHGLAGYLEYKTALVDPTTAERWMSHLKALLETAAADRTCRLSELALLSAAERHQLLVAWNDTAAQMPGAPVHRLLESQAARSPHSVALACAGESLTYAELDARATRLARRLRALGVGRESLVGVALQRSPEMLVAVLAAMKAGGAYLPLDPAYPAERLGFMLRDSGAQVLISTTAAARLLPGDHGSALLLLDGEAAEAAEAAENGALEGSAGLDDLAYVIYTSGSTGQPKGVGVTHRGLANFLASMLREPGLSSNDVLLAVTSLSFDIAALELYLPLLAGARIEMVPGDSIGDGRRLAALLALSGATVLQATPATWRMLLHAGWQERDGLRLALAGGEALGGDLAQALARRAAAVWNVYGPTETTVWSTALRVEGEHRGTVPIGRPIGNTSTHVLDAGLHPVPLGVPGELYIGGEGVARGYLGRPQLTAERFVPDALSGRPGERLYRTGDLVRLLPDGRLDFLGRIDQQVKVRGFRIEPGEIEAVLAEHPGVRQAVVVARQTAGDQRLLAYVVPASGQPPAAEELRDFLRSRQPEHMMPAAFVVLEGLPLTPSGKIDRKALPEPERTSKAVYVAPRGPIEELLAEIYAELLGTARVGAEDDFFALGGHSLLVALLLSRVRAALGAELPVRDVFEAPTVAALAARIEQQAEGGRPLPPIDPVPRHGPLPLSFSQERLWFLHQLAPGSSAYNIWAAFHLEGPLGAEALAAALNEVVRRHETLRTTFVAPGGEPRQLVHPADLRIWPAVDLRGLPGRRRRPEALELLRHEALRPFDLVRGPLLRCVLARLAGEEHIALVAMHHIVSDGWSMERLVGELATAYGALSEGRPVQLPELRVQYPDYAVWQRRELASVALEEGIGFWRQTLQGAQPLRLPTCRTRPAGARRRGARLRRSLPPGLVWELRAAGRRHGATLFMVLLAGLDAALFRWTGSNDLVVGTVAANRSRTEAEPLIGCLMNFLALRVRLNSEATCLDLLERVREATLGAFAHESCPFEKVVEMLNPERRGLANPLFEVAFLLQNYPRQPVFSEALRASAVRLGETEPPLDLRLVALESGEGLELWWEHDAQLFDGRTIEDLAQLCEAALARLAREPQTQLLQLSMTAELALQASRSLVQQAAGRVAISATFTAEPVEDALQYGLAELGLPLEVEFAPYNQVFQQLLDPASVLARNQGGVNVILVRLEDWQRYRSLDDAGMERQADELARAFRKAAQRSGVPQLLVFCPASPAILGDAPRAQLLQRLEEGLTAELRDFAVIAASELVTLYPVADYHDPHADEQWHVPYSPEFFAALGTAIARRAHALLVRSDDAAVAPTTAQAWDPDRLLTALATRRRRERPGLATDFIAPRSLTEEILAGIWSQVLGVGEIGAHDNFFDLGGHSLRATQVLSRIRESFQIDLPLQNFFQSPTLAGQAEALDALRVLARSPIPPIEPVSRDGPLPLSFAQQRLWFLDQLEPGGITYNVPLAVRLEGRLHVAALRRALCEVVRRHEALRTTFPLLQGEPVQVVAAQSYVHLPVVDLADLPDARRQREVRRLIHEETRRSFDLAHGPLLQGTLIAAGGQEHALLLLMHHIISDAWSIGILVRELGMLYTAFSQGLTSPLPELEIQYVDFSAWQRRWLSGSVLEAELGYWRDRLGNSPPVLRLPTDRARPAVQTSAGAILPFHIPEDLSAGLRALSRRRGATLYMTLLAAFQALLSRHSGQQNLAVGTPIAGRNHPRIEELIGFFVNTLVLRTELAGDPSFLELLTRVREVMFGAHAHQDLPFEKLVEELQPERDLSHSPLFQVTFTFQNAPVEPLEVPGLRFRPLATRLETAKVDLLLMLWDRPQALQGSLEYSADLFDASTVVRLGRHLLVLLGAVVNESATRLSELPLWAEAERHQALVEWNDSTAAAPQSPSLHQLFSAWAREAPDAVGLTFGEYCLSYRALDQRSNQLARHLQSLGIGPEVPVGVCAERSLELVIAVLAIWKAGGVYLPLDPSYPAERLRFMIEDSGVLVLLTQDALVETLPFSRGFVVRLDADWESVERESDGPVADEVKPGAQAYLIYTSGSTGRAKGVMVAHLGLACLAAAQARLFGVGPGDRVLQFASPSFDASVWEVAMALGNGASLCLAERQALLPGPDLYRLLQDSGITLVTLPPTALAALPPEAAPGELSALHTLIVAGEACPVELARRWGARRHFVNAYGPTETTVCASVHVLAAEASRLPLGRPIDNTRIHLLDGALEPVPVGVTGALYIAGAGLARGYLGRPELTAESFLPNPFDLEPGSRLYRTGDLARHLPDGQIEFLGRADHQVKVRGFRIELGEVESALVECGAREAAVLIREAPGAGASLVAYAVVEGGSARATGLRKRLREKLPAYMVPTQVVLLRTMPLLPNGKVDRGALALLAPEPERSTGEARAAAALQTPEEELLAGIFAEVLQAGPTGSEDNFFDLGGHSLLATQLVSRIQRVFGVELSVRAVFETPTVAGLAAAVRQLTGHGEELRMPPIGRRPRGGDLPLSFAQERLWFLDQLQPDSSAYNIALALGLRGHLSWNALAASLDEVVARHEVLRTTFAVTDGRPVQVVHPELRLILPVADLSDLPEGTRKAEADRLVREEAARPFDLARGPLVRAALLRLDSRHHVAVCNLHHIVSDGWSMGVLVQEVGALYAAFCRGERPALPELPIQYADFALWQRQHLAGGLLAEQISFWKEHLAGAPAVLDLPSDRPRQAVQRFRGAQLSTFLSSDRLPGLAGPRQGTTPFMVLLAAFQALLSRLSGQEDLVVGTPVAGRNRLETENLIGFFVNTLALRADLGGDPRFADALARVREVTVAAYAHEDLPFEKLVEELQPERSLAHAPVLQVVMVLQNAPRENLELPGLTLEPLPVELGTTKFDLTVSFYETPRGLLCSWEHDSDQFDQATIRRFQGCFATLLAAALADPAQRLSDLPLLGDGERRQLLAWNRARPAAPPALCLHELFARQARARPTAVAVSCEGRELTYRELDGRSELLARHLRAAGVGPEVPVALCLERSPELVVALLAVLKAGGAYVPIDPAYPRDRQAYILEDSGARVLLSERGLASDLSAAGVRQLLLDELGEAPPAPEGGGLPPAALPESLAYVIYTSGSTGRPKGVLVRHANVIRLFRETEPWFSFDERDVWTLFHSPAFDFSVWEIWGALLYGGRLVVVPYWVSRSPDELHELLRRDGVTVLNQTPSAFRQLIAADAAVAAEAGGLALRFVIFGGEALDLQSLRPWLDRHGDQEPRLINMYGITETTVHVTWRPIVAADLEKAGSPIGVAIPDLDLRVLDRSQQQLPIGVPGELCVGGAGLARGYLGRPELTAERFVPDPFGAPGARLYRSGDLARYRTEGGFDGDLEHLGRIDHQVKIRGFRIELGEIESVLSSHPGVRESVVEVREDGGDRRLVAYVVPAAAELTAAELRDYLRERQPEPMVPAAFVLLERLPLTAHGKVDRKALPAPDRAAAASAWAAPGTPAEAALAALWAELLGVERVGIEDNFFALGGDSILAVRLVSRANAALGTHLRVQDVFQHQTVAALASCVSGPSGRTLADEQAAGLAEIERLCRAVLADERQRARLPEDREDFYPLSSVEKGMIFHSLLLPDEPIYHDQSAYILAIPDLGRFERALALVVDRHPIFRTGFHLHDFSEPMKVVHPRIDLPCHTEDLSALRAEEQRRVIERYRAADLLHRFAFDGELLWRLKIFRLDGELCCVISTWHHAVVDGWSSVTFWAELNEACARPDLDRLQSLPALASSYKDYLAITLGRRRAAETESFWRETLAGAGRNRLPFQRVVARETPADGMHVLGRRLGRELLAALRERARASTTSLQALCLAAHVHLLQVTSGESDVVTGVVSHDRPGIPDGDKIIGCFLNTFPIRLRTEPGETGSSLVRRVARYLAEEKAHEIPLVDIATLLGTRQTAGNPIFDTLLNFTHFRQLEEMEHDVLSPRTARSAPAPRLDLQSREMTNTLFDLEVSATLGKISVRLKYSPRHFEAADIEWALALYERILEGFARDLEAPLGGEALLSAEERAQLVGVYNDTARDYPRERPLHSFFEERAALHPDLPAVLCGSRSLTYGELDRLANRVARMLLARGVQPGDNVGVCLERSPELVAALFGVLKAGAAYVPLEPSYPAARKEWIARQSAISFLLEELPEGLLENGTNVPDAPVPLRPRPDDLAYTIYTSGSTGTPKGVMIEHHSAVNLIGWVNRQMAVGPGTRVLMLSSVCFDLSVYDIFGTLGAGGEVVIARQEEVQDPAALTRLVFDRGITFWNSVPSTLGLLVRYLEETDPELRGEELRVAFLSGDWIPLSLPDRARRLFPNLQVVSLGGATEGTVWSIWHPVGHIAEEWQSIPYGRPIDNNTFYVLDSHLELVPPGVVGDLYIGGIGVARGYAGDAEKTASSYRPDPFAGPGRRLYRTGDLGRMLHQGEIEFLGRSDSQVKVRGFRVELGEIESQLVRHPQIQGAVVAVRSDRAGEKSLCAYFVSPEAPSTEELRAHLADTLPRYMVPDVFVELPALPLTPNGKIDRRALPEPGIEAGAEAGHVAPAGALETELAEIWGEVLGVEGIGARHDFFALGGHSLSAIQVLTRVRQRFQVDLPLRALFEEPTVAGLATTIERLRRTETAAPGLPLLRRERPQHLPLSFAQERLWFLDRLMPGSSAYNLPLALAMSGRVSWPLLAASLSAVAERHEVLRTTFSTADGQPAQVIAPAARIELPFVDLRALPAHRRDVEARWLARREAARPFDLERGPLLRAGVLLLGEESALALFALHHSIADGWSMGLLVQEVGEIYGAWSRGGSPVLPELPVQYADFALWQRSQMAGEELARQLAWWREYLAGAPVALDLPTDHPRPAAQRLRGAQLACLLPADLSYGIARLRQDPGTTLFIVLMAAYQALMSRLSGQDDLVVGSPVANRNRKETESLIGFFANTLALRGDLSGDPTFRELLERVRGTMLGALAHEDLPFERLVEELNPERGLARSPIFQVALALNAPQGSLDLPGLSLELVGVEPGSSKFDVSLSVTETPQGGLFCLWDYDSDLFDAPTVRRLHGYFAEILAGAAEAPTRHLSELSLLAAEERHQILCEWNDTASRTRPGLLLHQLFEEQVDVRPEAPAAVWEDMAWSYAELEERGNRLANFLVGLVDRGTPVGVWMERSLPMLATVLGILKAGGTYVPLDAAWPAERVKTILARTGAPAILVDRTTLPAMEEIRWRVPRLADVICLDVETPEPEPETLDTASIRSLFDFVAERATDRVTAGGFVSRVTGLPFTEAEVDEYRDRVLSLAAPWLRSDARVLEVGCGSGLILWEMARQVGRCVGLDPSERTQKRNRERARNHQEERFGTIELPVGFAHEIAERFAPASFDLIVLASTVQFFPGPRYFERVVTEALRLLAPGGALLIADVMDARREPGADQLALDEDLFHDLGHAEIHHRTQGFANELGERYDVILRKGGVERRKRTWTGWHVARGSAARPAAAGSPLDVAYIIYTSGSTGAPKGIAVQHAPAVQLADWVNRTFGVGPGDRLLFVASLCFDLSVYDIFGTLAAGGTVHVASEAALREPSELVRLLREEPITIWDSAPAALQQLSPLFPAGERHLLRLVLLSGDWIPVPLPDQVRAAFPGAWVFSLGGATEATVWSNWYPIGTVDPRWPSIPYGRPIANAHYHVLDRGLLPCPIGVPGDLYIGGSCLCVGYAGQPELTAAAFGPDPFAATPGARLYRTGDRARYFPDGNLEFLGRADQQVKVRGYRIELGEIEAVLLRHQTVREAVVIVREDLSGEKALVAYTVPREEEAPEPHELRAWLGEKLPAYMIPAAFVMLPSLPVTANGKLDRGALPVPEWASEAPYLAPRTAIEEALATIWGEILKRERIGIHDNFFDLGGHSLLATRVVSRIHADLQVEVPLRELFESRTLAGLATAVEARSQAGGEELKKISETLAHLEQLSEEQILALLQEGGR